MAAPVLQCDVLYHILVRSKKCPEICSQTHHAILESPGGIPVQTPSPSPAEGSRVGPLTGLAPTNSGSTAAGAPLELPFWPSPSFGDVSWEHDTPLLTTPSPWHCRGGHQHLEMLPKPSGGRSTRSSPFLLP